MDSGKIDLAILDGEATPAGGMGIAKQLKDEIYRCPPVLVLTGRPQDAWLATWSRADGGRAAPARPAPARRDGGPPAVPAGPGHPLTTMTTPAHSWPDVLSALIGGHDLHADQAAWAMGEILAGEATPVQIAGFAVALRAKGETIDELEGLVASMYEHANPLVVPGRVLDVVGTGGDRSMSVNISTMAAIVAAGAGAPVVKHGNRSASSKAGSADVLEALGIRLDLPTTSVAKVGEEVGHHLLLLRGVPPGHAARRHRPPRARGRDHLQRPRPVGQPGEAVGPGDRLRRRADGAVDGRRLRPTRRRRVGVPRRRRARRAHHHHHVAGVGGRGRRGASSSPSTRRASVSAAGPPRACAGATPPTTPRSCAGCVAGETGPVRDAVVLNAGAALAVHAADAGHP